jgi:hypothetical protein
MILLNLPSVFGIAAAALALMLLVKIATSPSADRIGKTLLLIFVAGLFAMAANTLYFLLGLHLVWPHLAFLWVCVMAWIGPAFWFYTARVLGLGFDPFSGRSAWHWVPGVLLQLAVLPFTVLSAADKVAVITGSTGRYFFAVYLFLYVQIGVYVLMAHRALTRHRAQVAATAEKEELRRDLDWINLVIYGFTGFLFLDGIVPQLRLLVPGLS